MTDGELIEHQINKIVKPLIFKFRRHYFGLILTPFLIVFNPFTANPTKWSNTLKQFVGKLPTNCLSVFDYFLKLALTGLNEGQSSSH